MREYFYRIYGWQVMSEFPIQEAWESTAEVPPEVTVRAGRMPEFLREAAGRGYGTWTDGFRRAWFRIPGEAEVYVEGGERILVERREGADLTRIVSLLLSAGMALIAQQRGEIFLHGSALERNGEALLLCGESGAGKSTLAMALLPHCGGFLADDTVRIHRNPAGTFSGRMVAEASYPQQKLCRDQVERYGMDPGALRYLDEERDKYGWIRRDRYVERALPVGKLLILRRAGEEAVAEVRAEKQAGGVRIRQLTGGEALEVLAGQLYLADTYRYQTGVPFTLMTQFIGLAESAGIYEVTRPAEGDTLKEVVTKVLQFC